LLFQKTKLYSLTNSRKYFISGPAGGRGSGILSIPNEEASVNALSVLQSRTDTDMCLLMERRYGKAKYFFSPLEKFSVFCCLQQSYVILY